MAAVPMMLNRGFHPQQQFNPYFMNPSFYPGNPAFNVGFSHPSQAPKDGGFPGIHLKNHHGGVGMEPGYNYVFPSAHCKVHVFKTVIPPWHADPWANVVDPFNAQTHTKLMVPVNTTFKELMQHIGCDNPEAVKNVMHEIQEAGNGKWVRGMMFKGDNKDRMKASIESFGWNKDRCGLPGKLPVVWVWATKA